MVKRNGFYEKCIKKWEEIHDLQEDGWIYRGQRDSTKELKSTLERACQNYEVSLEKAKVIENRLLREFKRKYHHYSLHIPNREKTLEWLSLMRHYGAPTRLIDFTYSIYVAVYFALEEALPPEEADKGYAVWAINGIWAINQSAILFEKEPQIKEFLKELIEEEKEGVFDNAFRGDNPKGFACPQNPFRLNERLTIQKGVFMCPGNVTLPFEKNLCFLSGWHEKRNIKKIIIPQRLRRRALDKLFAMNISRATLFPGLDGFAQSLKVTLPPGWDYVSN
jgi:hypothetical protein